MKQYDPEVIEKKWQSIWSERKTFSTPEGQALLEKPKSFILDMFPYPSGAGLHVGHPKSYTASDVISRMRRMQGFNVLHVMGWDAFGLPAERAAEREGLHPAIITKRNIDNFRRQLQRVGFSYDWDREISTAAPDYYKWTQWIFLQLYEKGLAYMADVPVNWCPALGTVLANEEVKDGKYVETGDLVERRLLRQWMLKITDYAERLLEDLDLLDWPENLKEMQRNWIGKSEGAEVVFSVSKTTEQFTVFTTRPDTLFGATYCVLAPEHPLVEQLVTSDHQSQVKEYISTATNKSDLERISQGKEKTGVFTGAYAVNPVNQELIPIWISDYVLISYGTGAIMAVPGHDTRDYDFARQYQLPIRYIIEGASEDAAYTGDGKLINSDFLNGLGVAEAKDKIIQWLEQQGHGKRKIQYALRDWLFSRQRYWGEPFPFVHLEDGTVMPVPESDLPVLLPEIDEIKPTADGRPPLGRADHDWLMVTLPDGRVGVRELNTMPQWAGSCWYYLRYIDPHNDRQAWSLEAEKYWMPVDLYIGGVEHAVLHLLYARFWHKVLYDCGFVSTPEPFQKLFNQGMVQYQSYHDSSGKYYYPEQVEQKDGKWFVKETSKPVHVQLEKMSKSKLNVVGLDEVLQDYGADSLRLYELFIGPLSASGPWQTSGIEGVYRFLVKVWRLIVDQETGKLSSRIQDVPPSAELLKMLHKTIRGVTDSIESIDKMNTAISKLMEFVSVLSSLETIPLTIIKDLLRLLSPLAPHIAEELWERLGETSLISQSSWPTYDKKLASDDIIAIPIQINGKLRATVEVAANISEDDLKEVALASVSNLLGDKQVTRIIAVPGKIVNIVAR